jgi:hypothetical protein
MNDCRLMTCALVGQAGFAHSAPAYPPQREPKTKPGAPSCRAFHLDARRSAGFAKRGDVIV